jgi:hypothetical protein
MTIDKTSLSERDICTCTKYITPAILGAGWDVQTQLREEVTFTNGRVIVRGRSATRGRKKKGRCGAARPRRPVEHEYLTTLNGAVPLETWRKIVERAVQDALAGDAKARAWLSRSLLPS